MDATPESTEQRRKELDIINGKIEKLDSIDIFVNDRHGPFLKSSTVSTFLYACTGLWLLTIVFSVLWTIFTDIFLTEVQLSEDCQNTHIEMFTEGLNKRVTFLIIMTTFLGAQGIMSYLAIKYRSSRFNLMVWTLVYAMGIFTFVAFVYNFIGYATGQVYMKSESGRVCDIMDNIFYSWAIPMTASALYMLYLGACIAFHVVILYRSMSSVTNPLVHLASFKNDDSDASKEANEMRIKLLCN